MKLNINLTKENANGTQLIKLKKLAKQLNLSVQLFTHTKLDQQKRYNSLLKLQTKLAQLKQNELYNLLQDDLEMTDFNIRLKQKRKEIAKQKQQELRNLQKANTKQKQKNLRNYYKIIAENEAFYKFMEGLPKVRGNIYDIYDYDVSYSCNQYDAGINYSQRQIRGVKI